MAQPKVFVSHSHVDDTFAEQLVKDLRVAGADAWLDKEDLLAGDFQQRISDALANCEWFVLVLTRNALKSPWVRQEVDAANRLKHQGRIRDLIFIQAGSVEHRELPALWGVYNILDARRDYASARDRMLKMVGIAAHEPYARAVEPAFTPPLPASSQSPSPIPTNSMPAHTPAIKPESAPKLKSTPPAQSKLRGRTSASQQTRSSDAVTRNRAILAAVTGMLVLGAIVAALIYFAPQRAGADHPNAKATVTAGVQQTVAAAAYATTAASWVPLTTPYRPTGVGPCAPISQQNDQVGPYGYYWLFSPIAVTCATDGTTADITGNAKLDYAGYPTPDQVSFPLAFTLSTTVAFRYGQSGACIDVGFPGLYDNVSASISIDVCKDGSVKISPYVSPYGTGTPTPTGVFVTAPYQVKAEVSTSNDGVSTINFSVNGRTVKTFGPVYGAVDIFEITGDGTGAGDVIAVSDFSVIPH